jgi:hypothetical protein
LKRHSTTALIANQIQKECRMSLGGDLDNPSPEILALLASTAPKQSPKDNDGIDESDDAVEPGKD